MNFLFSFCRLFWLRSFCKNSQRFIQHFNSPAHRKIGRNTIFRFMFSYLTANIKFIWNYTYEKSIWHSISVSAWIENLHDTKSKKKFTWSKNCEYVNNVSSQLEIFTRLNIWKNLFQRRIFARERFSQPKYFYFCSSEPIIQLFHSPSSFSGCLPRETFSSHSLPFRSFSAALFYFFFILFCFVSLLLSLFIAFSLVPFLGAVANAITSISSSSQHWHKWETICHGR